MVNLVIFTIIIFYFTSPSETIFSAAYSTASKTTAEKYNVSSLWYIVLSVMAFLYCDLRSDNLIDKSLNFLFYFRFNFSCHLFWCNER